MLSHRALSEERHRLPKSKSSIVSVAGTQQNLTAKFFDSSPPQSTSHLLIELLLLHANLPSMSEELSYAEVAKHSTKKDLYIVIHDKVYNASSFVDEHP